EIVRGTIVRRVQKYLEVHIGDGILVDPERLDFHWMIMETTWRILPGILDVDSDIVKALNLNSRNPKGKLPGGDLYHFCRRGGGRFGRSDLNDLLRQDLPLIGECLQWLRGQDLHPAHQSLYRRVRIRAGGEERPKSVGFDLEAKN